MQCVHPLQMIELLIKFSINKLVDWFKIVPLSYLTDTVFKVDIGTDIWWVKSLIFQYISADFFFPFRVEKYKQISQIFVMYSYLFTDSLPVSVWLSCSLIAA